MLVFDGFIYFGSIDGFIGFNFNVVSVNDVIFLFVIIGVEIDGEEVFFVFMFLVFFNDYK